MLTLVRVVEPVVDLLPERLWRVGKFYALPAGNWHFCVGAHPRRGGPVRTIEWRGREIARGRRPFEYGTDEQGT
jgi:hypothetical protein